MADQKNQRAPGAEARLEGNAPRALDDLKTMLSDGLQRQLEITEDHIQSLLLARRARDELLGKDLFSDPAWDLLLELYSAELGARAVSLDELALAIEAPPSTAARWLSALDERGLTESTADPAVPGRILVRLTSEGLSRLDRLARRWGSAFVSI